MKKTILLFACSCIISLGTQAQGLYLGAGFGYGFKAGSTVIGTDANSDGSTTVVKSSYGAGMTPNVSVGYMFSKLIGAELNAGYLIGKTTTITDNLGTSTGSTKFNANSFYLNPSLVLRATNDNTVVPYAKAGLFLGFGNMGTATSHTDHFNGGGQKISVDDGKFETKGGVATGLTSTFGLDFMLTDRFSIYGELFGRLASWSPQTYTNSNTSIDYVAGVAQAPHYTSVSGNFVKETPGNYTGTNIPRTVMPYSAIGFNVGVRYYFWQ